MNEGSVKAPSIVVMGVSGSGKSTFGALLAQTLGLAFVDGDTLHSDSNRKKMAAGTPLDDVDRAPWLQVVGTVLARGGVVVACSALRHRYRDPLRQASPGLRLVYLSGERGLLARRLAERAHEFMPAALLRTQLESLEPPDHDERPITLDIELPPNRLVQIAIEQLRSSLNP